jgi:micrococcal nuclease
MSSNKEMPLSRESKKASRILSGLLIAAVIAASGALFGSASRQNQSQAQTPKPPKIPKSKGNELPPKFDASTLRKVVIKRAVDGDTLLTEDDERIRLIGIDTPETLHPNKPVQAFGKEASAFTKKMANGKTMYLEFDHTPTDKYGRTLAFAYFADGRMLNVEILRQGFAHAYKQYPHKYLDYFCGLERDAREQRAGLWAGEAAVQ